MSQDNLHLSMLSVKRLTYLFSLVYLQVFTLSLCLAQSTNSSSVSVFGLTIPCKSCQLKNDPCMLALDGNSQFFDCSSQVKILLTALKKSDYRGQAPSLPELRAYLYSDDADAEIAAILLYLMLRTEAGSRLVLSDGKFLLDDYEKAVSQVIQDGKAHPLLAKGLWNLSQSGERDLSSETLAGIAANTPEVSLSDLFAVLGQREDKSIQQLARIEYLFRSAGQVVIADQLHEALISIDECIDDVSLCERVDFSSFSPSVVNYLGAVKEKNLVSATREKAKSDPALVIEQIKKFAGGTSLSKEGHKLIVESLKAARLDEFDTTRRKLVRPEMLKMLRATAERSDEVAEELAELLTKVSRDSIATGEIRRSMLALKESLEVYPKVLESRSRLIIDYQTDPAIQTNSKAKEALDYLLNPKWRQTQKRKAVAKKNVVKKSKLSSTALIAFIAFAAVLWMITIYAYYRRQRGVEIEDKEAKIELDIWRKERDKRHLKSFFNLNDNSTEEDLVRNYRLMAKSIHPDTSGQESNDEFRELSDLFEQARRLLFR